MDYLRQCYESDFLLNAETGETIRGRFFWAEQNAQVFPGVHPYGSAVWVDTLDLTRDFVGDQFTNVSEDLGVPPPLPLQTKAQLALPIPDRDCCGAPVKIDNDGIYGMKTSCFKVPETTCNTNLELSRPSRQNWAQTAAYWISRIYQDDPTVTDKFFQYFHGFGTAWNDGFAPALAPKWRWAEFDCLRFAVIAGTTSSMQFATQALSAAAGPISGTAFKTSPFWRTMADYINTRMEATSPDDGRMTCFVGHSYGGALAQILAADRVAAGKAESTRYITFGAPRAGDADLYLLLAQAEGRIFENEGDIVPALPPANAMMTLLAPLFPLAMMANWNEFAAPRDAFLMSAQGGIALVGHLQPPFLDVVTAATILLNASELPGAPSHQIAEYVRRLSRCRF